MTFCRGISKWISFVSLTAVLCAAFNVQTVQAQNQKDLENKQKKVEQTIQKTQTELQKTKTEKAATLKDYGSLQKQIQSRSAVIETVQTELSYVTVLVEQKNADVLKLEEEIKTLREAYANVMQRAYKASLITNEWMLILSASSINQAFYRWQYLRNIKQNRRSKVMTIADKQLILEQEMAVLLNMKNTKQHLLDAENRQTSLLSKDLATKDKVLANLTQSEKNLLARLNKQKKEQKAIAAEIAKAIRKEIEKKEREAREYAARERKKKEAAEAALAAKNAADGETSVAATESKVATVKASTATPKATPAKISEKKKIEISETPESASLSADFQSNRGNLPWPVRRGAIVRSFGTQGHPELSHVTINNNGIDIKTDAGADALVVFNGEVVHIAFLTGYKNTVMVNHGKYYTIYSNLDHVTVSKGQKVKKGDSVGKVGMDSDSGNYELHFELWSKQSPLNPSSWLKAK